MYDNLIEFTEGLPPLLQWLGVMLAGAIPFIESYGGSVLGIFAGIGPVVAIVAAIAGNIVSMLIFVLVTARVRTAATAGRAKPESPKRAKLRERFDRFGVPGVSLLGQTLLPSQITAAAMVSFGASRNAVIRWQILSIILWGVVFGVLAVFGINLATA